jgi:Fe-S-cluster containining protein
LNSIVYPFLTVPLIEKVREVERVFKGLDEAIGSFQNWSTLHCKFGCGKCCSKADIEATALEFLPFAHYLYQQELAFEWLEKIKATDQDICLILNPTQAGAGQCSEYLYRGLICRLFGYSARTNKYGDKELVTCQIIKTEQAPAYELAQKKVIKDEKVPIMNQYYMQLHAIDAELARDFYPINQAIKKAIETVLHYYAYRN